MVDISVKTEEKTGGSDGGVIHIIHRFFHRDNRENPRYPRG